MGLGGSERQGAAAADNAYGARTRGRGEKTMRRSPTSRLAAACIALVPGLAQPALAQQDAETAANLRKPMHLRLGATTASAFVAAIRAQTGLNIALDPALVNRRLIVEEDGLTAGEALADVIELNDWRLRQ